MKIPNLGLIFIIWLCFFSTFFKNGASVSHFRRKVKKAEEWLSKSEQVQHHIDRLISFIQIPSISVDKSRNSSMNEAAKWLEVEMEQIGLENVQVLSSPHCSSVYGELKPVNNANRDGVQIILLYGHYDIQPADNENEWTFTKPFEPKIVNDKIYGRGSSDDKGHLYSMLSALHAWVLHVGKQEKLHIKVFLEGEEEIGSPNLQYILNNNHDLLKADYVISADGSMIKEDIGSVCLGLRGRVGLEVVVSTANMDLHSGTYGGGVMNSALATSYLVKNLWNKDTGKVNVDGFYDNVIYNQQAKEDKQFSVSELSNEALKTVGVNESIGENGFSFYERTSKRPSLDVIGIIGGYTGDGDKTVLPYKTIVKLSVRMVPNQNCSEMISKLSAHFYSTAAQLPGVQVSIFPYHDCSQPVRMWKESLTNTLISDVLSSIYNKTPIYWYRGPSIPALAVFQQTFNAEVGMMAFALSDENHHAPNEFVRIKQLRISEIAYVRLFEKFAS